MSKKKAKPVQAEEVRQKNILALRGTEEWKEWLDGLAVENGAPVTVTVERALRELAERLKYRKPPKRVP